MKYGVAALVAAFMLFALVALGGAGHGWMPGALGCLALTPVSFFAWVNALSSRPSLRSANATLALGIVVFLVVIIATTSEGIQHFFDYWRVTGLEGILIASLAYLNSVLLSLLGIFRAHRVLRVGT